MDSRKKKRMKVVYVAGAYNDSTRQLVQQNINNSVYVGYTVMVAGAIPVIPHAMFDPLGGVLPESSVMRGCLELLSRCDAVVTRGDRGASGMVSKGTKKELRRARHLSIPVFYLNVDEGMDDFFDWVSS